jgi:putative ABC transport system permease protein
MSGRRRHVLQGSTVWLAVLTLCVVFAATAGVREALVTRTTALRQTLAAAPALSATIDVTGTAQGIRTALASPTDTYAPELSEQQTTEITDQLHGDLNQGVLRLAPGSADWAALDTQAIDLTPTPKSTGGIPVKLEIAYRQPLRQYMRLVAGSFPQSPVPAPASESLPGSQPFYPVMQVLVSEQTASRFDLKVGSRLTLPGPSDLLIGRSATVTIVVSGIVTAIDLNSAFWQSDPAAAIPSTQSPAGASLGMPGSVYWVGGLLAVQGESAAVQDDFGYAGIIASWFFPLSLNDINGGQAQPLYDTLNALSSRALPLSGDVASASTQLTASSGLPTKLAPFLSAAQSADVLLWLLYVSLTVAGLVVLLLAGRMVVLRRSVELAVIRARGASLRWLGGSIGGEAALACVPAAVIAVALGILAVPAAGGLQPVGATGAWWSVVAVLVVAVGGPTLMVGWRYRPPRRRAPERRQRARVRPVAEVTLILAAVAGLLVFRQQGLQPGSGVNLYTSAAPVLIAVPAVIVVFRLYPVVLRWLLRAATRTSGAPAFLGLARAARTALTPALPAFALVLTLSIAAFGGMVRDAVANGEVAASWQTTGADATITPLFSTYGFTIPAATADAIARVPGVTHAAQVWQATWSLSNNTEVIGLAVDPAAYAALVAATQGYPAMPVNSLATPAKPGAPQPVLASPSAAAELGTGTVTLTTGAAVHPISVRVAGTLSGTPALPSTSTQVASPAFVIMPLSAVKSSATPPLPVLANEMLLSGSGIDRAKLAAVVQQGTSNDIITYRSDVLAGLSNAPLQHGAVTVITLSIIAAAALGLAVMLLELALGAAERDATLARLATMGLADGQRARVVALELLPAVIAAAVAAWACALVLPPVVRPVIDLSVFTGSSAAVPLAPDVATVALPLAGLLVLAAMSLGIEIRAGRRRGAGSALRIDG